LAAVQAAVFQGAALAVRSATANLLVARVLTIAHLHHTSTITAIPNAFANLYNDNSFHLQLFARNCD